MKLGSLICNHVYEEFHVCWFDLEKKCFHFLQYGTPDRKSAGWKCWNNNGIIMFDQKLIKHYYRFSINIIYTCRQKKEVPRYTFKTIILNFNFVSFGLLQKGLFGLILR